MQHGEDDRRLAAEGELALARLALDSGDLAHAARHVAYAFALAPTLPEAHETLSRLATRAGGAVLDLFPVAGDVYVGAAVAHAHLIAARQPTTAFDLLIAATQAAPGAPWAAVPWLEDEAFPGRWNADELAQRFMRLAGAVPEPVDPELRPALEPYLRLARRAIAAHPNAALLLGAASGIARRFDCLDEAVDWATRAAIRAPGMLTEMWLGYAHRAAGNVDEAVAAWSRALAHDPDNLALHTDLAEILAAAGRLDEALRWIERAMAIDPADNCAFPTACVLRFLDDGDVGHLVALSDHVRAHPDNDHARTMLTRACLDRRWLGHVGSGDDAVSDLLRQVLAVEGVTAGGTAKLSGLEPPSPMLTLDRTIPGLQLTVANVPAPDIREPRRPDGARLWVYPAAPGTNGTPGANGASGANGTPAVPDAGGTSARPAMAPPDPRAAAAVAALAEPAWAHPAAAYDAAVHLAGIAVEDLVALLAHPPVQRIDAPPGPDPGVWVRAVQVWACLGVLHHRTDEPWAWSTRRRVLIDLAFGIEDWASEAALFALVTAAWVDPGARADVAAVVRDRLADAHTVSRLRAVSIIWSLARLALATPGADEETRWLAREILETSTERTGPGTPLSDPDGVPAPPRSTRGPIERLRRLRRR